jgi:hypothetical protein
MRTKLILFAFIASYVFFSCSNDEDGEFGPSDDPWSNGVDSFDLEDTIIDRAYPMDNYVFHYVFPNQNTLGLDFMQQLGDLYFDVTVHYSSTLDEDFIGTTLHVNGDEGVFEHEEGYMEYAEFYGDTAYGGWGSDMLSPRNGYYVSTMPLEGIELTALTDYNENYPANSSLNSIAELGYWDVVDYISENYPYDSELCRVNPSEITKENPVKLPSLDAGALYLRMLELPTPDKQAVVQVKLTFGTDPISGRTVEPIVLTCKFKYVEYVEE